MSHTTHTYTFLLPALRPGTHRSGAVPALLTQSCQAFSALTEDTVGTPHSSTYSNLFKYLKAHHLGHLAPCSVCKPGEWGDVVFFPAHACSERSFSGCTRHRALVPVSWGPAVRTGGPEGWSCGLMCWPPPLADTPYQPWEVTAPRPVWPPSCPPPAQGATGQASP